MVSLSKRDDRGVVAVEFALVAPLLLMLLFGIVNTAMVYSDHLAITNAAREGARYGAAATGFDTTTWATSVRDRVKQVYFNAGSTLTDSQICAKVVDSTGATVGNALTGADCGTAPTAPANLPVGSCAVLVWVSKPQSIDLVMFPAMTFRIGAQAVNYYGRAAGSCTANN